jgi:hypothetical protein
MHETFRDQQWKPSMLILKTHTAFQKRDSLQELSMCLTSLQATATESNFFLDICVSNISPLMQYDKML